MICPAAAETLHRIGEYVTSGSTIRASPFRVLAVSRPKIMPRTARRCRAGCGDGAVDRGALPTEATVAQVPGSKMTTIFAYRQAQFPPPRRQYGSIDVADWVGRAAFCAAGARSG